MILIQCYYLVSNIRCRNNILTSVQQQQYSPTMGFMKIREIIVVAKIYVFKTSKLFKLVFFGILESKYFRGLIYFTYYHKQQRSTLRLGVMKKAVKWTLTASTTSTRLRKAVVDVDQVEKSRMVNVDWEKCCCRRRRRFSWPNVVIKSAILTMKSAVDVNQ